MRNNLLSLNINFSGTITDLPKATTILTGNFAQNLHELMALFLCHSRKLNDKYYSIHLNHDGLSYSVEKLEKFQAHPDVDCDIEMANITVSKGFQTPISLNLSEADEELHSNYRQHTMTHNTNLSYVLPPTSIRRMNLILKRHWTLMEVALL